MIYILILQNLHLFVAELLNLFHHQIKHHELVFATHIQYHSLNQS